MFNIYFISALQETILVNGNDTVIWLSKSLNSIVGFVFFVLATRQTLSTAVHSPWTRSGPTKSSGNRSWSGLMILSKATCKWDPVANPHHSLPPAPSMLCMIKPFRCFWPLSYRFETRTFNHIRKSTPTFMVLVGSSKIECKSPYHCSTFGYLFFQTPQRSEVSAHRT